MGTAKYFYSSKNSRMKLMFLLNFLFKYVIDIIGKIIVFCFIYELNRSIKTIWYGIPEI